MSFECRVLATRICFRIRFGTDSGSDPEPNRIRILNRSGFGADTSYDPEPDRIRNWTGFGTGSDSEQDRIRNRDPIRVWIEKENRTRPFYNVVKALSYY
jgi:hypothetical protein